MMHIVAAAVAFLPVVAAAAGGAGAAQAPKPAGARGKRRTGKLDPSFLSACALVCVDLQPSGDGPPPSDIPDAWKRMGITLEDARAAVEHHRRVCLPSARRVADACRSLGLPMVFLHWGYRFRDGMDLAPAIRKSLLEELGPDPRRWPHHIDAPDSRPAPELGVREGEYVLPKTDQDAFTSSNLGFLLENLGVRRIVFVGGHVGACLGKTAASARRRGYEILCVTDATNDAAESRRMENLRATGYHHLVTAEQFLALVAAARRERAKD